MNGTKEQASSVYTTQEAAAILGMSVTSVQKLVESGELPAWKTTGGHRRIPREAVSRYRAHVSGEQFTEAGRTRLLIVEDDELLRALYQVQIAGWELPLDLTLCASGYEGLIEIGTRPPDVLLLDISMRGIDGYELLETVLARPALRSVTIAIVSGLGPEDLALRGGIPPGVGYFPKPVSFECLRGFVTACCVQKQRRNV